MKTAAIIFASSLRKRLLDRATSKGSVTMRYALMIADGRIDLMCSKLKSTHKASASRSERTAAGGAALLSVGFLAFNTSSAVCMQA